MSQHVIETCGQSDGLWLPLTEYAVRSGISLSTIRRKIKSNRIPFRLEKGRYLILYEVESAASVEAHVQPMVRVLVEEKGANPEVQKVSVPPSASKLEEKSQVTSGLPIMESAVRMVGDAFERALKEKDERIKLLEKLNQELHNQLGELRTLVRTIEEKYDVRY